MDRCVGVQANGASNLLDEVWSLSKSRKRFSPRRIEVGKRSDEFAVEEQDEFIEVLALQLLLKRLKCTDIRIKDVRCFSDRMFGLGRLHACPSNVGHTILQQFCKDRNGTDSRWATEGRFCRVPRSKLARARRRVHLDA